MSAALWKTKLFARLHDPAEKSLVLLRDPAGHENGTCKALQRELGLEVVDDDGMISPDHPDALSTVLFSKGIPKETYKLIQRADWFASAADRPQWPVEKFYKEDKEHFHIRDWARVNWAKEPILIHPLTGDQYNLHSLDETEIADIKDRSLEHFKNLVHRNEKGDVDFYKTLLAFWRFGPILQEENDFGKLGQLWSLLPADTRIPDHSIWDHLDLTSAFAGAFFADSENQAALLTFSIGPVQPFIAAARTTSDLWAGSHLLSRIAWEALKIVCKHLGPDSILYPRLRGLPLVDVWLLHDCKLRRECFDNTPSCKPMLDRRSDGNPVFSAALPNRFVLIVPQNQAKAIAQDVKEGVQKWMADLGNQTVKRLLEVAGINQDRNTPLTPPYSQMQDQLSGFPEVFWAAVPFSLIRPQDKAKQRDLDVSCLVDAMQPFYGTEEDTPGFLGSKAWDVLQSDINGGDNLTFYKPNPGVLYPALYDLSERVLASVKTIRPFQQSRQEGWRDSLTGEYEWLTTDRRQLLSRTPELTERVLWGDVHKKEPSLAKENEKLGALSAVKRVWPSLFVEEIKEALCINDIDRFVVSTHTMALAYQLNRWLQRPGPIGQALKNAIDEFEITDRVALPQLLVQSGHDNPEKLKYAYRIPALLEKVREIDGPRQINVEKIISDELSPANLDINGNASIENYYALLLMDGDWMGKILSGDPDFAITFVESFHPRVKCGFEKIAKDYREIKKYGGSKRPVSPNRHMAISTALSNFSMRVVPFVVEKEHAGRLIYSGGDDVLAMLPVADLIKCATRLRTAYNGSCGPDTINEGALKTNNGFAKFEKGEVMRMMGEKATVSCGAVIVHHLTPLNYAIRKLRESEKRAKNDGGRDAFSLTVLKRSGGDLCITMKWDKEVCLLKKCSDFLRTSGVSRRVSYKVNELIRNLPQDSDSDMLTKVLRHQFKRQSENGIPREFDDLAGEIAKYSLNDRSHTKDWQTKLEHLLSTAEFLAREVRSEDTENIPA